MSRAQVITFTRALIIALVDEYDKLEGGDRVFYKAWLGCLPDDVIYGIAGGDPVPGPSAMFAAA